jgi:hypothetical protein
MPHLTDPKRELYRTQARLARGEAAVLVPATGLPPWYAWQTGQEASTLSTESDGATTLHSWTTGLLELVEDPGHERFRLSAEIRHQDSTSGLAGLYFFYTLQEQAAVREHFMAALQFNDRELEGLPGEDGTVQNPLSLRLWRWLDPPPPDGQLNLASQSMHLRQFVPAVQRAGASLGIWRKLEIEFAPEQLRVRFDGQECPLVDAAKLQRHVARLVNERPALAGQPPRFSPRQPLGLFVYRGSVSFRNVVISPLPEQP